jgi:putative spermidine/putrescine transport system ATP-binding protein
LDIRDGEFFSFLGPSGSGKTTTLRLIAGFEFPSAGSVWLHGREVTGLPPYQRDVHTVFQDYALFPHMSVAENVAYSLMIRKVPAAERNRLVTAILETVRLPGMGARRPAQLSGGQRQRVSLARALVDHPRVLLLDEPLGALDLKLRQEMQVELKVIQRQVGITFVFVTHDQEEALTLSDRVAIFNEGKVVQAGKPLEVYERPTTAFAANFLGDANFFEGRVEADGRIATESGALLTRDKLPAMGQPAIFAVRPEKIALLGPSAPVVAGNNRLEGRLTQAVYSGMSTTYKVSVGSREITVFEQNRGAPALAPGAPVRLEWSPVHSVVVQP